MEEVGVARGGGALVQHSQEQEPPVGRILNLI